MLTAHVPLSTLDMLIPYIYSRFRSLLEVHQLRDAVNLAKPFRIVPKSRWQRAFSLEWYPPDNQFRQDVPYGRYQLRRHLLMLSYIN